MSEELYLYFRQSDQIVPLVKMIAGRTINPERNVNFDLSEYFSGSLTRISRKHFAIHEKKNQFFIEDLGSGNGTDVDGDKLRRGQRKKIQNGSEIILAGRDDFIIEIIDEATREEILIDVPTQVSQDTILSASEDRQMFYLNGRVIPLTDTQREVMHYLYRNTGRTCSFYELNEVIWFGRGSKDVIRQMIRKIRKRLDKIDMGAGENHIKAIRGEGYQLVRKYTV